jgi:hypothetical protein
VVELADHLHRTIEGMEVAIPVVTDIHPVSADPTITVEDIKFPKSKVRILRPRIRHPADLHTAVRSIDEVNAARLYSRNTGSSSPLADRCYFTG